MAKKKTMRYICPVCYATVDLEQVHYACNDPQCARMFLNTCKDNEAKRYSSAYKPEEEIDVERSEFLGLDPNGPLAVTTKYHIIRGSADGKCDICGAKNTVKLCPRCHNVISKEAEKTGTSIYALVGSRCSGKSHYLASLIELGLSDLSTEFGLTVKPASDNTAAKFREEYEKTIFDEGKCLPVTPSYSEVETRDPLLYDISSDRGIASTVALFDTSGADLDITDKLASLNISTFLADASGILFFIDPLQLPEVRRKLGLPTKDCRSPAETLEYISEIIRDKNHMKPKSTFDIPLAVIISKCDLIQRPAGDGEDEDALLGPESALHIPREHGKVDTENIIQVSTELEEYLRRNIGQEFLNVVSRFEKHEYFAVSAIGASPLEGNLINGVSPYRVEDPMIWFLNNSDRRKWF